MWLLPIKSYLGDGLSFPTRNFGGGDIPDYQGLKRFLIHKAVKEQIVSSNLPLAGDHLRPSRGPSVLRHESPSRTLVNPTLASEREREASSSTVVRLDQNGAARTVMVAETELTDPSAVQINGGY